MITQHQLSPNMTKRLKKPKERSNLASEILIDKVRINNQFPREGEKRPAVAERERER
eukprot:c22731_g1_i1 orf=152-322(+)